MWCSLQVSQSRRAVGSLCSGWWLTQSLTLVQVPVECWALSRHWYHNYHHHHYPKHDERGGRKIVRARGWVGSLFWTWQGYGTHELLATVVNCIRSSQDQGNQYSNVGRRGAHKASAQAEQLLAVDCYWKKENHLSSRAWPWWVAHVWVDGPTSVHEVGSVDIKTKEETWSWEVGCVGGGSGRSWRGQWRVYVIKIHCINLQNSQRINKISLKLSYNSGYFGSQYLEGRLQDHDLFINSSSRKSWSNVWGGEAARGPVI